jgi:FkbM family methyltransferase
MLDLSEKMSWRTHPLTIGLRSFTRYLGVNRFVARVILRAPYESSFHDVMFGSTLPGDCAWDIGANVGLYTLKFAERVGKEGCVFAFEPSTTNRLRLENAVKPYRNVTVLPVALGEHDQMMPFQQGSDELGATSRILTTDQSSGECIPVSVVRGDNLLASGRVGMPNVIKIDTEGFELDVLHGLGNILNTPALRALFIEVHFDLLRQRGLDNAPRSIERLLSNSGFDCRWADPSHVVGIRPSTC